MSPGCDPTICGNFLYKKVSFSPKYGKRFDVWLWQVSHFSIFYHIFDISWIHVWKDLTKIQRKNRVVFFNHRLLLKRDICACAGCQFTPGGPVETWPLISCSNQLRLNRTKFIQFGGWTKAGTKSSTYGKPLKGAQWQVTKVKLLDFLWWN